MTNTLPLNLYFIRHGESEANIMQSYVKGKRDKTELSRDTVEAFLDRHDYGVRLSRAGVEQAKIAGNHLRGIISEQETQFYVSPLVRACETAYNLGFDNAEWNIDDRVRERDWGEDGVPTVDLGFSTSEVRKRLKYQSEYYWKPLGGESLATGVRLRFEAFLNSLTGTHKNALVVSHGEFMRVAMSVLENLTPEEYNLYDRKHKLHNTTIFHYTRTNPHYKEGDGSVKEYDHYRHRRVIVPFNTDLSWDGGAWVEFDAKRRHSNDALREYVSYFERILPDH